MRRRGPEASLAVNGARTSRREKGTSITAGTGATRLRAVDGPEACGASGRLGTYVAQGRRTSSACPIGMGLLGSGHWASSPRVRPARCQASVAFSSSATVMVPTVIP